MSPAASATSWRLYWWYSMYSNQSLSTVCRIFNIALATWVSSLSLWTYLEPTYVFGIREYHRGSVLKVHRDRLQMHLASVILNIFREVDSSWPLYIEDHMYRGHNVYLEPGEMIFLKDLDWPTDDQLNWTAPALQTYLRILSLLSKSIDNVPYWQTPPEAKRIDS